MLTIRALPIAALLLATPTFAESCENHCKVRIHVCLTADESICQFQDILPDEAAGLCSMLMTQIAYDWIIKQRKLTHMNWSLESSECVRPDDNRI